MGKRGITSDYFVSGRFNEAGRLGGAYVYVLLCQDNPCTSIILKIGMTEQPSGRLRHLRSSAQATPRIFSTLEVRSAAWARKIERALHTEFSAERMVGEWFRFAPDSGASFKARAKAVLESFNDDPTRRLEWAHMRAQLQPRDQRLRIKFWEAGR